MAHLSGGVFPCEENAASDELRKDCAPTQTPLAAWDMQSSDTLEAGHDEGRDGGMTKAEARNLQPSCPSSFQDKRGSLPETGGDARRTDT